MRTATAVLLLLCLAAAASAHDRTRGVHPDQVPLYEGKDFVCLQSGERIDGAAVNDDYCDCADGTDEPGTSACSHILDGSVNEFGHAPRQGFYCPNKGHVARTIPTSLVNDGVCDCCDGSDEYSSTVVCTNKCKQAGAARLEQMQKEVARQKEGLRVKQQWIAEAVAMKPGMEEELTPLREQLAVHQAEYDEMKTLEEEAKHLSDIATELEDDDGEAWIREDEETDDEERAARLADKDRQARKAAFEEEYGMTIQEADDAYHAAKKKTRKAKRKLDDVKSELAKTSVLLDEDFGEEDEYYKLYQNPVIFNTPEYTYTLKSFEEVQQGSTSLGKWEGWTDNKKGMKYTHGRKCWNAGDRETTVSVVCGSKNEILDVEEPNTCVYTMTLATPAACSAQAVNALEEELAALLAD
eukprot:CAMPEP_0114611814 /NCGR_PEP_ID=MMETSP0168-20121206/4308_1 /TAXON_ID=95228 ORGANISM="Vannella sp., Strain DIVA3 517/6/12" /NCGR_SAMPLE_ID=MMETSP0168 /ASSEMBLY_ACC=CAM_ASM_000044 /LENGTH=410 /DNA_ID=CAMNT_0001822795 /DNA_START=189 /DNA_END=1421 /DNA_ORIENTATION=-